MHEIRHGSVAGPGAHSDHRVVVTGTDFPLAVTAIAPGASPPDVDLALFDPSGTQVASAGGVGRQEDLSHQPAGAGAYTVRVTSASGAGGYFLDISGLVTSPPVNEGAPGIAGEAREGQTLIAGVGRWSGGTPLSFAFQWVRCDASGSVCAGIPDATGGAYNPVAVDIGSALRVVVTASNAAGTASATAGATAPIAPLAPANTKAPTLAGRAVDGRTVRAATGEWRSSQPLGFAYRWRRCSRTGSQCADIAGVTGAAYKLRSRDAGRRVGVVVTATNGGGSASAASAMPLVDALKPRPTARPKITGTERVGRLLKASRGHWRGTPPVRYGWRWSRCNASGTHCDPIPGARNQTYRLRRADIGRRLRVRVFADNRRLPGGARMSAPSRATRVVRR